MEFSVNKKPQIIKHIINDDGQFPNSSLFLLIYKNVFNLPDIQAAFRVEEVFESNDWSNSWKNSIFDYMHYHSNTHEVLGIITGNANIQFGGPQGVSENVAKGDVIIIPAGVAHKCNNASKDFECIGAYPEGKDYDMKRGEPAERPEADKNILKVSLPDTDPVYGPDGPLILHWEMQ